MSYISSCRAVSDYIGRDCEKQNNNKIKKEGKKKMEVSGD